MATNKYENNTIIDENTRRIHKSNIAYSIQMYFAIHAVTFRRKSFQRVHTPRPIRALICNAHYVNIIMRFIEIYYYYYYYYFIAICGKYTRRNGRLRRIRRTGRNIIYTLFGNHGGRRFRTQIKKQLLHCVIENPTHRCTEMISSLRSALFNIN